MGLDLLEPFALYPFLLAGVVMTWRMRSCQSALSLLVFSSIFASFLGYSEDLFDTIVYVHCWRFSRLPVPYGVRTAVP